MDAALTLSALAVFLAGLVQSTPLVTAYGITVNIVLVALVVCVFIMPTFFDYALVLVVAALGLKQGNITDSAVVSLAAVMIAVYGMRRALPFTPWVNYMALIIFATAALYGLIDWHFIARTPLLFAREVFYNALFGACAYVFIRPYERTPGYQF